MAGQIETPINYETLEATSDELFNVLHEHGVFGNMAGEDEGHYLKCERRGFKTMIRNHVTDNSFSNYLEITYRESSVRLLVTTEVNERGEAKVKEIDAYDHPWENEKMDYAALNSALHAVLS